MPLISFSKSRSQKSKPSTSTAISSFGGNGQRTFAGASTSSFHVNTSSAASCSSSRVGYRSLGRTKDRFSKAFTFSLESFNVVGSIRGRSKPISNVSNNASSRSISQSYTTYTGYEDEDYGEPDAEAEEIRPPSGLGRAASVSEFNSAVVNEPNSTDASVLREPRISESSDDGDSLVEIRYPSGLGNIKLTVTPVSLMKGKLPARSTYPDFYLQCQNSRANLSLNKCGTPAVKATLSPFSVLSPARFTVVNQLSSSGKLCKLLTILSSYLDTSTLRTLTLVCRNVGLEARRLLWCHGHIALRFVLSGTSVLLDGQKAMAFLDFLSRKDVSHFIRSLELICSLVSESSPTQRQAFTQGVSTMPHRHPRSRPPPLSLVLNNYEASRTISQSYPSIAHSSTTQASASSSPFRRARMMLGHPTLPNAFRNSNLGRRLSMLTSFPRVSNGLPIEEEPVFSGAQTQSSHLPSLSISSSTWQPPPEWNRVDSPQRSASPSSFRTATPLSSRFPSASATKYPLPSPVSIADSIHKTKHIPSLPNLKPGKHHPRLSLSLLPGTRSTPSLNPHTFPVNASSSSPDYSSPSPGTSARLPPPSFRFEQSIPNSPSFPATPVTPHSAISLSAFPLPPSATSSHSWMSNSPSESPPTTVFRSEPPQFQSATTSSVFRQCSDFLPQASSDLGNPPRYLIPSREIALDPLKIEPEINDVTITAVQPGFIDGLKMGLKELANLEAVTIRYDITEGPPHHLIHQSNLCYNLLRAANQLLVGSLKDIRSLKSIQIACPKDYSSLCAAQLSELENIFTNVRTSVIATNIP